MSESSSPVTTPAVVAATLFSTEERTVAQMNSADSAPSRPTASTARPTMPHPEERLSNEAAIEDSSSPFIWRECLPIQKIMPVTRATVMIERTPPMISCAW